MLKLDLTKEREAWQNALETAPKGEKGELLKLTGGRDRLTWAILGNLTRCFFWWVGVESIHLFYGQKVGREKK